MVQNPVQVNPSPIQVIKPPQVAQNPVQVIIVPAIVRQPMPEPQIDQELADIPDLEDDFARPTKLA